MADPIVVIGGGIAGICCIQQLAEQLPTRAILLVTSSNLVKVTSHIERFGLNLVRFDVEDQHLEQFKTNYPNVRVIIDQVTGLEPEHKRIRLLKSAERIRYDKLVICTGASPKPLNVPYNPQLEPYCCLIRDTETVRELEKKFAKSKRVCILGNGGIATELVFSIRFCRLVWIMRDQHITSTFLDAGAAHFLRSFISKDPTSETNDAASSAPNDESQSTLLSDKVVKRLKYTIVEGECTRQESINKSYGSALGPDWQQKFELKGELRGEYLESSKNISFEKNCELSGLLRYEELADECKSALTGQELFRDADQKWPVFVQLTNGKVIGCDLLINAIGVRPNSLVVETAGGLQLASDGGILVDQFMRTNLPDVYATGDVCTPFTDPAQVDRWLNETVKHHFKQHRIHTEHWHQIRLWTQARQMGVFVANSIALRERNEPATNLSLYSCFDLFTHMTSFFGFKVILIGAFNGQQLADRYEMLVRVEENKQYVKVIVRDGRLKGCILIGETDLEETFENLIVNQLDISDIQESLLENTVDLEDYFD